VPQGSFSRLARPRQRPARGDYATSATG
jgi:hypothetical protein